MTDNIHGERLSPNKIEKAMVALSHTSPEIDLDAYDELEALDEIIVGM